MEKKLTARVSSELHQRVRQAALKAGGTVDRFIEDALLKKLEGETEKIKGSDTLNALLTQQLPEQFLRDCVTIYQESLDTWYALARITSAIAHKKVKRATRSDALEAIEPLPGEAKDKKDNTG